MRAYSIDLRERIVAAYDQGGATQRQVADRFEVSLSLVRKLLRQRRAAGSIAARPRGGGHAKAFDAQAEARLRQAVRDDPDATLAELAAACGVGCGPSAVFRTLDRLGITREKNRGVRPSRTAPN